MATCGKTLVGVVIGASLVLGLSLSSSSVLSARAASTDGDGDGVFIHITKGPQDAHAVLMALQMAQIMSEDKKVLVYVDVKGIELLLKDGPDLKKEPFDSSRTALDKLLAKGVPVLACPGCLKAAHKKPEDLMPGVKVATKEAFFGFAKGRILTLDY
jgi:predicted peroxiredoxin